MLQVAYKTSEINTALGYMKDLVKVLKEKGTDLFFVQTPFKVLENETVLPEGITDETNETADRFLAELDKIGVNILDLRQNLKESGMDTSDFFFKTDHHWTHRSAFWGYTQIVNALRDDWGHNVNPDGYYTNLDNFVVKDIKNCYFAHFGTYYNKLFVGLDDITLIYPKFETKYTYMNNQNGKIINRSGSFFDAILDSSTMNYNEEPVTSTRYHTYINASCPYVEITNESAPCDINLLIVKDSFSLPVIAWLSLNYKHITVYDAAQNTQFTLYQLLEKKSFDMMLMIYNPDICFVLPRQYKFK
ncbi:hypothetical protein SDC9_114098 [bioreactor metagenome]|uniref:AlgX/AlgJ SGNH hydrolase-like domain-containing protein n=1 Tax=bioreactor metagenome TaxID=1076179 RepID=A0A645BRD8_9ZZZZ